MHFIPLLVAPSELTFQSSFCGVVNLLVCFRVVCLVWFWFGDFCLIRVFSFGIFAVSVEMFSKGSWDSRLIAAEPGLPTLFTKRKNKVE